MKLTLEINNTNEAVEALRLLTAYVEGNMPVEATETVDKAPVTKKATPRKPRAKKPVEEPAEPKAEEPKAEEPKAEEPKPKAEEPKAEAEDPLFTDDLLRESAKSAITASDRDSVKSVVEDYSTSKKLSDIPMEKRKAFLAALTAL